MSSTATPSTSVPSHPLLELVQEQIRERLYNDMEKHEILEAVMTANPSLTRQQFEESFTEVFCTL